MEVEVGLVVAAAAAHEHAEHESPPGLGMNSPVEEGPAGDGLPVQRDRERIMAGRGFDRPADRIAVARGREADGRAVGPRPAVLRDDGRLLLPRKCAGVRSTRQPGPGSPRSERGRETMRQPWRAWLANPIPAASSRRTKSSFQPFSPNDNRTAGLAMPTPSSVTVTVRMLLSDALRDASPIGSWMVTVTPVAPALLPFWKLSTRVSMVVAAQSRVTRWRALSWILARMRPGQGPDALSEMSFMGTVSVEAAETKSVPPAGDRRGA